MIPFLESLGIPCGPSYCSLVGIHSVPIIPSFEYLGSLLVPYQRGDFGRDAT